MNNQSNRPLVSITIPIYNVELYLKECIASVQKQTYSNLEILCVNDGSSDSSKEIVETLQDMDSRIVLINQENAGVSVARNVGMRHAKGEWILFLDADDVLATFAVENMLNCAYKHGVDIILPKYTKIPGFQICGRSSSATADDLKLILLDWKQYNKLNPVDFRFSSEWALAYSWGKLIRRNIVKKELNKNLILGEDLLFNFDLFSTGCKVQLLNDILYYYRPNGQSVTANYQPKRLQNTKILSLELYKRVQTESVELQQACRQFIFGRVIHCYFAYFDYIKDKQQYRIEQKELLSIPCINESIRKGKIKFCIIPPSKRIKLRLLKIKLLAMFLKN